MEVHHEKETACNAPPPNSSAASPSASQGTNEPVGLSGTLEVWSSGEELDRFVEGFNKLYPDVTVNITVVPNADFIAKLTPTLTSGQSAPDIFTGESDYWDDLKQAPYNADTSDVWDYVASVGTDESGVLRALSWQASPGSVMYRRDMGKDVLGTDDPTEVAALLNSNEAMLAVAAKLKDKGIKMFASWQDIMNMQFSNWAQPWVVDDKLVIDDSMLSFVDMLRPLPTTATTRAKWYGVTKNTRLSSVYRALFCTSFREMLCDVHDFTPNISSGLTGMAKWSS